MKLGLSDRIALITGGASGIGQGIAGALRAEGCEVFIADLDLAAADFAAKTIGAGAHALAIDVTDPADVERRIREVAEGAGRLDILINSAGILQIHSVIDATIEDWQKICAVNLSGTYYCLKAALPFMLAQKYGRIINIASVSAIKGGGAFGNTLYGTTKAGVVAMSKGFARELGPHGITVNAISPGVVDTAMTRSMLTPELRERMLAAFPMQRFPSASEVADLAVFLASDAAAAITGQNLIIDCGFLTK